MSGGRAILVLSRISSSLVGRSTTLASKRVVRRDMATAHEPQISRRDNQGGKVTLREWVEANRHIVGGGIFALYVSLGLYFVFKPKKRAPEAGPEVGPEVSPEVSPEVGLEVPLSESAAGETTK